MNSRLAGLLLGTALLAVSGERAAAVLLSDWSFDNDSISYGSGALGSLSSTAAAYGEAYASNKLAANTSGTVFSASGIYVDFSNLVAASVNNAIVNGVAAAGGQAPTSSVFGGYGAFSDSSSGSGSLIVMNPTGAEVGHYLTLSLSSAGYSTLSLAYSTRLANGYAGSEVWSYSLDGTSWTTLSTLSPTANSTWQSESLSLSTLSGNALNNQSTFYFRMTISSNSGGGSYAFDNLQLTGTAVPEPAEWALLLLGAAALACLRRRRFAVAG